MQRCVSTYWLVANAVMLCISSCVHEEIHTQNDLEYPLTKEEARAWFETWSNESGPRKVNSISAQGVSLSVLLDWESALQEYDSTWTAIIVPWEYETISEIFSLGETYEEAGPEFIHDNCQFQRLVVLQNREEQTMYAVRMVIVPSATYIEEHLEMLKSNTYLQQDPLLDGALLFYTINGYFINGWGIENGTIVSAIEPIDNERYASGKRNVSNGFSTVCYDIVTCYYYYGICGDYVADPKLNGCEVTDHTCRLVELKADVDLVDISRYDLLQDRLENGGVGGGGMNPPIGSGTDPCEYLKQLQEDTTIVSLINYYTERCETAKLEDGCMICEDGTIIDPTQKLRSQIRYSINTLSNQSKIRTSIHLHPGGVAIPSVSDLKQIYNLCQRDNITDIAHYSFIIVSATGTTVIQITDKNKLLTSFSTMLEPYRSLCNTNTTYNSFEEAYYTFFSEILKVDCGLSILFGTQTDIDTYSINHWDAIQTNGQFKNPCL